MCKKLQKKKLNYASSRNVLWSLNKKLFVGMPSLFNIMFLRNQSLDLSYGLGRTIKFFKNIFKKLRTTLSSSIIQKVKSYYSSSSLYERKLNHYTYLCTTGIDIMEVLIVGFFKDLYSTEGTDHSLLKDHYINLLLFKGRIEFKLNKLELLELKTQTDDLHLRSALHISQLCFLHLLKIANNTTSEIQHFLFGE